MRSARVGLLLTINVWMLVVNARYDATWESLDSRPLPGWYDDAKIGIFLHWGVFSVPSFGSAWFWKFWKSNHTEYVEFMKNNYQPGFTYQDFGPKFTAEFFDPEEWARIFNASGARYVVLTSKHHEGFTLWPSETSWNWNAKDIGPNRDLVGDLAAAVRKIAPHIHFGLYHSLFEFYNPIYLMDKENNFKTNYFVTGKTGPELFELVNNYKPDVIWSDGEWEALDTYWNSTGFLAWLFNESPVKDTVVVNDRWGSNTHGKDGSYYNYNDRYNPGVVQPHKWENCMTLDKHAWTYRRNAHCSDFLTMTELLTTLAETVSCGGNLLVNTGPSHDGMIAPLMEERLLQMGEWLSINGEAIYGSQPWTVQNDTLTSGVWFTGKDDTVYGIMLSWPSGDVISLGSVQATANTAITLLGDRTARDLQFKESSQGLHVVLPQLAEVRGRWAWVLKMVGVKAVDKKITSLWQSIADAL